MKFPISEQGFKNLKEELLDLKNNQRPAIIRAIAEARSHGDLSENAEYHSAREKQGFIEAKIAELEYTMSKAEVIDISEINTDFIQYGATIKLLDEEKDAEVVYKIVSEYEANISKGLISIKSPLAQSLLTKKEKDSIEFKTPKGIKYYEVLSIRYD